MVRRDDGWDVRLGRNKLVEVLLRVCCQNDERRRGNGGVDALAEQVVDGILRCGGDRGEKVGTGLV